ncbi:flagellar motor protein MotB [Thermodesulfobacteriota bacterium]
MKRSPNQENTHAWNGDALLKILRRETASEDNVSWLITFADLMTILLIFSFVLFIANYSTTPRKPLEQESEPASLVPLVHANTKQADTGLSVPVYIDRIAAVPAQAAQADRVIESKVIVFDPNTDRMPVHSTAGLRRIAALARENPGTKIIIIADIKSSSKKLLKKTSRIIDYLERECGIAKKSIFLQAPAAASDKHTGRKTALQTDRLFVIIKLTKPFWWL